MEQNNSNDHFKLLDDLKIPKVKKGDIIKLKNQYLLCDDCLSDNAVNFIPNNIKLLFTSPPYIKQRNYHDTCEEDKDFSVVIDKYANKCQFLAFNLGLVFRNREVVPWWDEYIKKAKENGLKLMQWMVWDKGSPGNVGQMINFIVPLSHEFIFLFGREYIELNKIVDSAYFNLKSKGSTGQKRDKFGAIHRFKTKISEKRKIFSCLNIVKEADSSDKILSLHPARFPIKLPEVFLKSFLNKNEFYLEPFAGSGTTLIAGELNDFKGYGIENNPEYCRIIIYRFIKVFALQEIEINNEKIKLDLSSFFLKKNKIKKSELLFENLKI